MTDSPVARPGSASEWAQWSQDRTAAAQPAAAARADVEAQLQGLNSGTDTSPAAAERYESLVNRRDILDSDTRTTFPPHIAESGQFERGDVEGWMRERAGASGNNPGAYDEMSAADRQRYFRQNAPEYEQGRAQEAAARDGRSRLPGAAGEALGEALAMGPAILPLGARGPRATLTPRSNEPDRRCKACHPPPPPRPPGPPISVPEGATVLRQGGPGGNDWVIYRMPTGPDRIRFRAAEAQTLRGPNGPPGSVNSTEAEAGLAMGPTPGQDRAWVYEGRHRAVGAGQGESIAPHLGGVTGQPGVLDYEFVNRYVPDAHAASGPRVGDLRNPAPR